MITMTTATDTTLLTQLAMLLAYPTNSYPEQLAQCVDALRANYPQAVDALTPFVEYVNTLDRMAPLEEAFTQSFDFDPDTALEVGWQLYGEDYERGMFLVQVRQKLTKVGLEENGELPDHLTHLLPLLERLEFEDASKLCASALLPAINQVRVALEAKAKKNKTEVSVYRPVLDAVRLVLFQQFEVSPMILDALPKRKDQMAPHLVGGGNFS